MNVTDNLMLYFQMQATTLPQTGKESTPGTSFRDQLQQQTKPAKDSTADKPQSDAPANGESAKTPTENAPGNDPNKEQLMAAAAVAPAALQIVDMTNMQPDVPVEAVPAEMAVQAQPVVQAETAQPIPAEQVVQAKPEVMQAAPQENQIKPEAAQTTTVQTAGAVSAEAETVVQTMTQQDAGADSGALSGQSAGEQKNDTEMLEGAAQETPVFHEVKATPVKVGEARTVHTEQGDVGEQLAKQVDTALQNGENRVTIRLTPENLGAVTVQLTRSTDGALHVALEATGAKALGLLEKHAAHLESMLSVGQQTNVRVEVQHQQESAQSQNGHPYDREGQGDAQQQPRQQQHKQSDTQDFLQQLRLGLIPSDGAAS